jgi:hypothetical protein
LAFVLDTVATLVGEVDQVIGTLEIGVPFASRTTPLTCVTSPTSSEGALVLMEMLPTFAAGVGAAVTVIVMLTVRPSEVRETVAVPGVDPAVMSPVEEIVATLAGSMLHVTDAEGTAFPWDVLTTRVACVCWPAVSEESVVVMPRRWTPE